MNSSIDSFGKTAQKLATNPLGIIALFIVLVYGIAGMVLGTSASHLSEYQRSIIVWFLVIFPVVVLAVFAWLVTRHHTKLYAPKDFPDASTFLRTLTASEQKKKTNLEVEELIKESPKPEASVAPKRSELTKDIYLAEDLVMREIEQEFGVKTNRQVAFGSIDGGIDGMFAKNGKGYGVEVKFIRNAISRSAVNQIAAMRNQLYNKYGWKNFDMILAVVLDNQNPEEVQKQKSRIEALMNEQGEGYHFRLYEYNQLLSKYGIEGNG